MQQPRVGVAVFVIKDDHILIGKRIGSHGAGTLQLPGGHLEFGEEWIECARREVLEETGLDVSACKMSFFHATNDVFENKHYITIFMVCWTISPC
jgi:8-oxo-dGTP diphosphatase